MCTELRWYKECSRHGQWSEKVLQYKNEFGQWEDVSVEAVTWKEIEELRRKREEEGR